MDWTDLVEFMSFPVRSGLVISSHVWQRQIRSSLVKPGYARTDEGQGSSGQVRSCQMRSGQFKVRSSKISSGQVKVRSGSNQVKVREGQVMSDQLKLMSC